jgi:conjugal transfer pilus assembly protein TraF
MAMRSPFVILALAMAFPPGAAIPANSNESRTPHAETRIAPEPSETYWRRNREGWFWYRDPPAPTQRREESTVLPARPQELVEFEAMQKRLDDLKRIAVMNPSDLNLVAYMRHQRLVMDKSERFAERWQRLVQTTPELDYGLTGRPTNAMAIAAFDEQRRDRQTQAVRNLASTHGLLFIYRSDCPYCLRFAPILKRFEETFGMTVFAVSLDGQGLAEYPSAQRDNGIAARLNSPVVPALYLIAPATRDIRPVGFGVMAMSELVARIAQLAQDSREGPL